MLTTEFEFDILLYMIAHIIKYSVIHGKCLGGELLLILLNDELIEDRQLYIKQMLVIKF